MRTEEKGEDILDIEELYDKIYRYCYYRLQNRELAEDITQETFLRWFASDTYRDRNQILQYLYTIARNLCIDEVRKIKPTPCTETSQISNDDSDPLSSITLQIALSKLDEQDRELILLRYVNRETMGFLCKLYGQSRFALYRRLRNILDKLRNELKE